MDQKIFMINELEFERMMKEAAKIGATTAIEKLGEEKAKHKREMGKRKLHNTELLMRNYRVLKVHTDNSVFDAAHLNESAADILINMMSLKDDGMVVESIKRSAERTAIMMAHIDAMLDLFKQLCERSCNELQMRKYDVLYQLYIAGTNMTVKQLAEHYNISKESVYADKNSAIRQLSALLFGIDALK